MQRKAASFTVYHIIIFCYFRSSTVPSSDPSPCANSKVYISEGPRPEKVIEAVKSAMDDVYTCMCDLEDPDSIFADGLFYHKNCLPEDVSWCNTA